MQLTPKPAEIDQMELNTEIAVDVREADGYFTVAFGPDNKYLLHIPVGGTKNKHATASNLFFSGAQMLHEIETRK